MIVIALFVAIIITTIFNYADKWLTLNILDRGGDRMGELMLISFGLMVALWAIGKAIMIL